MTTIHNLRNHLRCDNVFVYLRRLIFPVTFKCIIQIIEVKDLMLLIRTPPLIIKLRKQHKWTNLILKSLIAHISSWDCTHLNRLNRFPIKTSHKCLNEINHRLTITTKMMHQEKYSASRIVHLINKGLHELTILKTHTDFLLTVENIHPVIIFKCDFIFRFRYFAIFFIVESPTVILKNNSCV